MRYKLNVVSGAFFLCFLSVCALALDKEDDIFYKAVELYSRRAYKESIKSFYDFIDAYPYSFKVPLAKLYIAKSLYFQDNYLQAIGIIKSIINNRHYQNVYDEAYYWLAKTYYANKDYANALNYIKKVIKYYPQSYFIWQSKYLLAQIYLRYNKKKEAQSILKSIIEMCPEREVIDNAYSDLLDVYYKDEDYRNLDTFVSRYLDKYRGEKLEDRIHFYLAESHYRKKEYDKAIREYSIAFNITANSKLKDLIRQKRGLSFVAKGDLDKALRDFSGISSREYKLFSYGVYYLKGSQLNLSLENFNRLLDEFPYSKYAPLAYLYKGDILYRMGRIKDASFIYRQIIGNKDKNYYKDIIGDAYYGLGWCCIKEGNFMGAINSFKYAINKTDSPIIQISSRIQIADSYKNKGKLDEAVTQYESLLDEYPDNIYADYIYFQIGMIMIEKHNWDEALKIFSVFRDKFPSSKLVPDVEYYKGFVYFSKGNFKEAQEAFLNFIQNYRNHGLLWKAYYMYGETSLEMGLYKKAIITFKKVRKAAEEREIKELSSIGIIQSYFELSDFENSEQEAKQFLRSFSDSPKIPSVYLYLGRIYEAKNDFSKAEYFYELVKEEYPESTVVNDALFSLGALYLNRGYLDKAQYYLSIVKKRNSLLADKASLYLGDIFVLKGEKEEALKIYRSLSKMGRINKEALLKEAFLLKDMKEYREAKEVFRTIINMGYDSSNIRLALGFCLEKLDEVEGAIEEYKKVVYNSTIERDKIKAYFRLARIYERKKRFLEAKEIYKNIIATGCPEAKVAKDRLDSINNTSRY